MRLMISGWVIECCLDPPVVGQQVEWVLLFHEREALDGDPTSLERLECTASHLPDWEGRGRDRAPVLLHVPGAVLYWETPQPRYGSLTLVGNVSIAQHGEAPEAVPRTLGRVARLQMAHTLYEEVPPGSRSWQPVEPLDVMYEELRASPKWFRDEETFSDGRERVGNALLVDFALDRGCR